MNIFKALIDVQLYFNSGYGSFACLFLEKIHLFLQLAAEF